MASTIKVDKLEGSTGSTITVPTGQTFTITDGIAASTIGSGTIADARLPTATVAKGGTNLTSFTAGDVLYATGSTTLAKLAKGTAEQVLAMNSGASAPDWGSVDLTVLPTITVAKGGTGQAGGFTQGDFLYATGATTLAKLAKGTALQQIRMNAGATAPEWTTIAAASADWVKLNETAFTSSQATIDWVNGTNGVVIDTTYKHYCVVIWALPATNGGIGSFRLSDDTGSSFETSGYLTRGRRTYYSGGESSGNSTAYILLGQGGTGNDINNGQFSGTFYFYGMTDASTLTAAYGICSLTDGATSQINVCFLGGNRTTVNNHDGIQFLFNSGSIARATATLYGMK
jgi:hypothetical protein